MIDDLTIPEFLRGSRPGPKPRWKTPWKRMRAERPEGAKWLEAERWEVYLDHHTVPNTKGDGRPRVGTRCVWVLLGRTWTEIRDAEGYIRIPTPAWNKMSKNGRKIS